MRKKWILLAPLVIVCFAAHTETEGGLRRKASRSFLIDTLASPVVQSIVIEDVPD